MCTLQTHAWIFSRLVDSSYLARRIGDSGGRTIVVVGRLVVVWSAVSSPGVSHLLYVLFCVACGVLECLDMYLCLVVALVFSACLMLLRPGPLVLLFIAMLLVSVAFCCI